MRPLKNTGDPIVLQAWPLASTGPHDDAYSTAFTMSSTTFFASPNTIIVLSM